MPLVLPSMIRVNIYNKTHSCPFKAASFKAGHINWIACKVIESPKKCVSKYHDIHGNASQYIIRQMKIPIVSQLWNPYSIK